MTSSDPIKTIMPASLMLTNSSSHRKKNNIKAKTTFIKIKKFSPSSYLTIPLSRCLDKNYNKKTQNSTNKFKSQSYEIFKIWIKIVEDADQSLKLGSTIKIETGS